MEEPIPSGKAPTHKDQGVDSPLDILLEIGVELTCPLGNTPLPINEAMLTPTQKDYPKEINPNNVVSHPIAMEISKDKKCVSAEPPLIASLPLELQRISLKPLILEASGKPTG